MTEIEILEGNRVIVEFLGFYFDEDNNSTNEVQDFNLKDLKYHKSWDWLMPVYQKINKYIQLKSQNDFVFAHKTYELHINIRNALEDKNCCLIFLFRELIKFIKFYNQYNNESINKI